jgi:1,4-dihydroxy-6-naphthoate synthase
MRLGIERERAETKRERYALLDSGSALGKNCGPLLVARRPLSEAEIEAGPIAIPGKMTTANLLLHLANPANPSLQN